MAQRLGREPGGIRELVELIDEYRPALAYDWRVRFGIPLDDIGESMDWREAVDLATELLTDSSSHTAARMVGHRAAWPAEAWLMADLFDALAAAHFKRTKPHPRPSDPAPKRFGTTHHSQAVVRAALAARGH